MSRSVQYECEGCGDKRVIPDGGFRRLHACYTCDDVTLWESTGKNRNDAGEVV